VTPPETGADVPVDRQNPQYIAGL